MYIMVDVESDGSAPGLYSMIELGAVVVEPTMSRTFHGKLKPISENWDPNALAVSGHTREQTMLFDDPSDVMFTFAKWLKEVSTKQPRFISDNNGFDWQFVNYYFHAFYTSNPFGHSSTNLGSLYKGLVRDTFKNFKHLRKTKHTHNPVDDCKGNVEALLYMKDKLHLNISLSD